MTGTVDLYYSFRSPYSYLATPFLEPLRKEFDIELNLRVVLPLAVRQPDFFSPENMKRAGYILIDVFRRAEMQGIPLNWPKPDPIVQDLETGKIAAEQPHIHRLSALGVEAQRRGKGIEFAIEVSKIIFGGVENWDRGDHLAQAVSRAGLQLSELESAIQGGDHAAEIDRNQQTLEAAKHWGVPTFVFQDEPFFGQDRIDTLRWRLEKVGLKRS